MTSETAVPVAGDRFGEVIGLIRGIDGGAHNRRDTTPPGGPAGAGGGHPGRIHAVD